MTKKKLSIKQISELAGVSVATVSRVINKNGRYSAETEQRVLQIIDQYQYKPNLVAKGLRTNNSLCIGVIVPDITNEFFASIVREIESSLFQNGYTTFICNTDEQTDIEDKYYEELVAKGVDGMIYISGKINKRIRNSNIPTIFIDRSLSEETNCITIESDNVQGGYLATRELIENNCKKIVLIRDKRNISTVEDRHKGYRNAFLEAKLPLDDTLIVNVNSVDYSAAKEAVITLIKKGLSFDGVFATTDWMALGAIDAIKEFGLLVPQDVKVVGFDNISISQFSSLPFTTIHQNVKKMSEMAVSHILNIINNGFIQSERRYIIPVQIIRRNSV